MSSGEERKLVTVLFADLVGSTAYAGDRDPERVRVQLERFYDAMRDEIERTGGTVEKFAGDAVMAVFGAPAALEDHAERALHAALAMQERLAKLFRDELAMRIGVNTGEVVVGAAREGGSFVTGDVVNVADRLQKAAEPGEVLAGERTVAATGGAFELGVSRTVEAKGKPGGVVATPVLGAIRATRARGVGGLPRVFVGRDSELELLRATYRRAAAQSEPHLVTLVGEPGVGKSRLVQELWGVLAEEDPTPVVRTGRCLAYGDGITYLPLGDIVREHFRIREGMGPDEVAHLLEGREMLGLALGLDAAPGLHPLEARERLHAAAVEFVEDIAAHGPAALLVEDVHWAEPDLLDLVERLVSDVRAPVLLLATARPEHFDERPARASGKRNATALWLDALPADAVSQLLERKLPAMPADLRDLVVERADGNPFFVEELVGDLLDSGVLVQTADGWARGGGDTSFAMPDTVHAVLAARIDRLPEAEKTALQAGSVIGRVFWRGPVLHLLSGEEPDFGLLEERDLIAARRESTLPGDREFVIKHALTREVAYGSIPKARRGRLHATFAEWLEGSGIGLDARASLLAYHYSEAARPEDADLVWAGEADELGRVRERAVHWLARGGELARGRYEMDEAIELFERAIDLSQDEHQQALLWREIGEAQALRYDGEAFWAAMERSLEGPLDASEQADAYSLLAFQTSIRSGMWRVRPRREMIERWIDRALEFSDDDSVEQARALLARVQVDPVAAPSEILDEVTELVTRLGADDLRSFAFGARSSAAFENLRFDEAADWSTQRLELMPALDDPDVRSEAYEDGIPLLAAIGRFDEARALIEEYWEVARHLSVHHRVHAVSLELELADLLGDWDTIAAETDRVADLVAQNLATPCIRNARDLLLCAAAHLANGDEARARALEREADALAGEGFESELSPPRLRLALARHDLEALRSLVQLPPQRRFVWGASTFGAHLDALLALREYDRIEREAPLLLQPGTVPEPFALRALGIVRHDDELLARADERFAAFGLAWHRAQTERLLVGL